MPTIISPYDVATTYRQNGDLQPWARVQEYRRVQEYCSQNPKKGSHAVSTALELPRSRIRPWIDGDSKPDPVHAIDTARELGWLNVDVDAELGHAWTRLVAWIYAGGSLATNYQPTFYAREDQDSGLSKAEVDVLTTALQTIGLEYQFRQRPEKEIPEAYGDTRPTEIVPTQHRTLFGRCLAAADAPLGKKNQNHPESLPSWLPDSSRETQRVFARIYLLTRAAVREYEPRFVIREQRPDSYHEDLVALFRRVSKPDLVTRSGYNVYLQSEGATQIIES